MARAANETPRPVHPVDEVLPTGRLAVFGFQHVLAMYAGAVAVPLILANAIGLSEEQLVYLINADLFTCGVANLIQTVGLWKVGFRLPIIQGVTFAAVTPMILIGQAAGLTAISLAAGTKGRTRRASRPPGRRGIRGDQFRTRSRTPCVQEAEVVGEGYDR